jgi:hypothetical protein
MESAIEKARSVARSAWCACRIRRAAIKPSVLDAILSDVGTGSALVMLPVSILWEKEFRWPGLYRTIFSGRFAFFFLTMNHCVLYSIVRLELQANL